MLATVEARWFMAGPVPSEALEWIQQWELGPRKPEERQDHYLRFPATSIGVKLRDGKFEVKRRDVDLGITPLGSRAIGRLALWRKWSFKVVDDGGNKAPDGDWITVEKERYLRKYVIEEAGLKAVAPLSFSNARGCTVELTRLQVRGGKWWSVGFEAFGPDQNQLRDTLQLVATNCFNPGNHPALSGEESFDYPEWLASLE
jgi:hypothetical protein